MEITTLYFSHNRVEVESGEERRDVYGDKESGGERYGEIDYHWYKRQKEGKRNKRDQLQTARQGTMLKSPSP